MARSSTISQPTAMRPRPVSIRRRSCRARSRTTVLATESANPKTRPSLTVQPSSMARPRPISVATRDLDDGARHRDGFDGQKVLQREMQADAEHQEDDADLREFRRQRLVGNETRREGADGDAGEQIADQRRYLQALRDGAENKREPEARNDGCDQRCIVRHSNVFAQADSAVRCDQVRLPQRSEAPKPSSPPNALRQNSRNNPIQSSGGAADPWNS